MQNDINITMQDCDLNVVYGVVPDGYQARELAIASYKYIAVDVKDIKTSYVRLGFHLFECRNNEYYRDFGFDSLADFAEANFGLDKSALSRCLKVYEKFSLCQNGLHKMFIDDRYKDYSYSQLCEMVSMNEGQLRKVKPSMTVKEIRSLKKKPDISVPEPDNKPDKVATSQQAEEKHDDVEFMALMEEGAVLPELPKLKNDTQRKEWLKNYKSWGLWYRDENIDVNYYRFDFFDGSRLIVSEYPQREDYWYDKEEDEYYFHLLQKGKQKSGISGGGTYDEKYRHAVDSIGNLVIFLKNLQKE